MEHSQAVPDPLEMTVVPQAPRRVQLSRAKGWRMPPNTVKVDRTTRYGNPFHVGMFKDYSAADAVRDFELYAVRDVSLRSAENSFGPPPAYAPLRGRNLACWCRPDQPCHVDVLLRLANPDPRASRP